jgi:S1-C subfamily serine protease
LEIAFKSKKFIEASFHYVDYLLDFAILKVSPEKIPNWSIPGELVCSGEPVVGSAVGAYEHPYSLSYSGSRGIVSGMRYRRGRRWVQTDAPINKGNSGGSLISLNTGKVIGINSATLSKRKSEGLGFAVPMHHACTLIRLLERGRSLSIIYTHQLCLLYPSALPSIRIPACPIF